MTILPHCLTQWHTQSVNSSPVVQLCPLMMQHRNLSGTLFLSVLKSMNRYQLEKHYLDKIKVLFSEAKKSSQRTALTSSWPFSNFNCWRQTSSRCKASAWKAAFTQAPRAHTEVLHSDVTGILSTPNDMNMNMNMEDEDWLRYEFFILLLHSSTFSFPNFLVQIAFWHCFA